MVDRPTANRSKNRSEQTRRQKLEGRFTTIAQWLFSALCSVGLSRGAFAQEPPRRPTTAETEAARLFQEGIAALKAEDHAVACARFSESQAQTPSIGALLNLADCEERAGRPLAAYERVIDAIALIKSKGDDRLAFAESQAAMLDRKIPRLRVRLPANAPPDLRVLRDGRVIDEDLEQEFRLEPGTYTFTTSALGRFDVKRTVTLAPAERRDIVLEVGAERVPASRRAEALRAQSVAQPAPEPHTGDDVMRAVGLAALGVGTAGLIGGVVTSILIVDRHSEFQSCAGLGAARCAEAQKSGKALLVPNTAFWGFAALGTGAGVTLLLLSRAPSEKSRRGNARAQQSTNVDSRLSLTIGSIAGSGAGAQLRGVLR